MSREASKLPLPTLSPDAFHGHQERLKEMLNLFYIYTLYKIYMFYNIYVLDIDRKQ